MKKTIDIPVEMIDNIVIDELKEALVLNVTLHRDEGGALVDADHELISALKLVLRYFAPVSEYDPFLRNLAMTEMVMNAELLGLYDDPSIPSSQ